MCVSCLWRIKAKCVCSCARSAKTLQPFIVEKQGKERYLTFSNSLPAFPALNPFEEQENVDARFVEETALKQTVIQLGFEGK